MLNGNLEAAGRGLMFAPFISVQAAWSFESHQPNLFLCMITYIEIVLYEADCFIILLIFNTSRGCDVHGLEGSRERWLHVINIQLIGNPNWHAEFAKKRKLIVQ